MSFLRGQKKQNFIAFSPSGTETKLNAGAQLQTFLNPTASKAFPHSNALMAKSLAQTLPFKSMTDKQTNK